MSTKHVAWRLAGELSRALVPAIVIAASSTSVSAQTFRGLVVDRSNNVLPGVLVTLVDSASNVIARTLSTDDGAYLLAARGTGTYRVRSLRIGFLPVMSEPMTLQTDESRVYRVVLDPAMVQLTSMHVSAKSSCGGRSDSNNGANAVHAAWEQATGAMTAASLNSSNAAYTATMLEVHRTLDASGRRIKTQETRISSARVSQPWRSHSMQALHRYGYVVVDGDSASYYPPGLDVMVTEQFLLDHCLRLVSSSDSSELGVVFEPAADRRSVPEVRGTVWMTRDAQLKRLDFKFTSVPNSLGGRAMEREAGGTISFVQPGRGAVLVKDWELRMPELVKRTLSSPMRIHQVVTSGGRLVSLRRGTDTLYKTASSVVDGTLRDSISGEPVAHAEVALEGTSVRTRTALDGKFRLNGVLPGEYTMLVRSSSLDSIGVVVRKPLVVDAALVSITASIPPTWVVARKICESLSSSRATHAVDRDSAGGGILGSARVLGDQQSPSAGVKVFAEWSNFLARTHDNGILQVTDRVKETVTDNNGAFRLCGLPLDRQIRIHASPSNGHTEPVTTILSVNRAYAAVILAIDTGRTAVATFAGVVQTNSLSPLSGVEIVIPLLGRTTRTDSTGRFRLGEIPPGSYQVLARGVGYGSMSATVDFAANRMVERRIVLTPLPVLEAVEVTSTIVDRRLIDFDLRRKIGIGKFYTRSALDLLDGKPLSSILATASGVRIYSGSGSRAWISSTRTEPSRRVFDAVDLKLGAPRVCYAVVFLDGIAVFRGMDGEPLFDASSIHADDIEALEYYAGPAQTPARYSQLNATCGAVVIWPRLRK